MAIQFKEIRSRTEDLMEQGNEAQNNVTASKARVSQSQRDLNDALNDLERASQTDEDGNPVGDVGAAQARVNMAQNQLDASKRALGEAQSRLESVNQNKRSLAAEIESHNNVERSNLEKLKALRNKAFAGSSDALSEGIASRLNEAEDARDELLRSLGLQGSGERASAGGSGGGVQTWGSSSFGPLDLEGGGAGRAGGGFREAGSGSSEGLGGAVPLSVPQQAGFTPVPSDFNGNPAADMSRAFNYADMNYDRSSAEWQENGYRRVESLDGRIAALDRTIEASRGMEMVTMSVMNDYLRDSSHSVNDAEYVPIQMNYVKCRRHTSDLEKQRRSLRAERDAIAADLRPEFQTTFRGFGGSGFGDAYSGIITSRQGNSVPGYRGTCGINESCSLINQQYGTRYDEKYGIEFARNKNICYKGHVPSANGGTSWMDRKAFLAFHNMSFDRVEGSRDTGVPISLDDVAARFNAGESCGLMLKAQDLSCQGIDTESRKFKFGIGKKTAIHNEKRFKANHATTIAGFSYDRTGKVAGVWINDTGCWTDSNRIYISRAKFNEMQEKTDHLAVEFSRRIS